MIPCKPGYIIAETVTTSYNIDNFIMNNVVVGMGEALWDVLPDGKKIGGAPANFVYHVSQFGLPSCVVSAVGDDRSARR